MKFLGITVMFAIFFFREGGRVRNREKGHRERKGRGDTEEEKERGRRGSTLASWGPLVWASETNLVNIAKLLRQGLTI